MGGYSTTYAITAQLFVFATQETPALAAFAGGGLDGFGGLGCNELNPRHNLNFALMVSPKK
ncbi:hypothetical protein KQ298_06450 [Synechococcus sp. CS-1330]|jgi:hypothetical protein|nr:hypothetical protein [Synechococcus sp. CS-1330]